MAASVAPAAQPSTKAPHAGTLAAEMRTACLCLTLFVTLVGATAACGSKQSTANTPPTPTGTMTAPPPPPPGGGMYGGGAVYPPGGGMAPPGGGMTPPGGGVTPAPPAGGGPSATPLDATSAAAASLALMPLAASSAPGMAKEGAPIAGNFQQGQSLSAPITIQPGKCYTFIAAGIGPQELEIQLLAATPIPGLAPMMGDQKGTAGHVVLGSGSSCVKLALIPVPVQATWAVKALQGGGIVAGQAYSK